MIWQSHASAFGSVCTRVKLPHSVQEKHYMDSTPLPDPKIIGDSGAVLQAADALVVGIVDDGSLTPTAVQLNEATDGWIERLISLDQIRSKRGELTLLASPLSEGPTMILVVGLGDRKVSRAAAFDSASAAVRKLGDRARERVVFALAEAIDSKDHDALVAGAICGCEGQGIYQSELSLHAPGEIRFMRIHEDAIDRGKVIGGSINQTRRLINEPAGVIYPESFAERASKMADDCGLSCEIWDEKKLEAEGCRAILAVGGGSEKPPRLLILRHKGGGTEAPLALVGKGVTFDSGGLSLKPSDGMVTMKCDMGGAATVFGVMHAISRLEVPQNVIGICGLAENMVSGASYKLGDVIETRSGKTIEILNTDAEGRVVLADALDVAIQHQPRAMIDLATLTGACIVALGNGVVGMMTNHQGVCDSLKRSADRQGELVWQLPMFDLFDDKVKSQVADIRNTGENRYGGAITAAKFLENFVADVPWVHLDIAGPSFVDSPTPTRDAGATGVMVRTLIDWIERQ